jgi:hypothetical protein
MNTILCRAFSIDADLLRESFLSRLPNPALVDAQLSAVGPLFAACPVEISREELDAMAAIIAAIERAVRSRLFQDTVLSRSPAIARVPPGPKGVFYGYDFHLGDAGPRLIEINTNAGGGFLNPHLAQAQKACCEEVRNLTVGPVTLPELDMRMLRMFEREWSLQRNDERMQTIAIVDDAPEEQFLYPEFLLAKALFEKADYRVVIADPSALTYREGRLWHENTSIDLVYNRLTDFFLEESGHEALRAAYEARAVVVTPHPHGYALYADKRNLIYLSDAAFLNEAGLAPDDVSLLLHAVPATRLISPQNTDEMWRRRRQLFFKPAFGYAGKAAYRGDKLTRRAWEDIQQGIYVAQEFVPPDTRSIQLNGVERHLKLDVRNYVYDGEVTLLAGRLYEGQTTNFRTPGGGFAPIYVGRALC